MSIDSAQHLPPPTPPSQTYSSPPVTIVLTIILLVFFFIGFFFIYFCRCFMQNLLYTWHLRSSPSGTPSRPAEQREPPPGLDPSIIQSFPEFTYSSVKDYRREKYGLECAICICEFEDDDVLRLLTTCNHVFHKECIDLWLQSHTSCPVCRRNLESAEKSLEKSPPSTHINPMQDINENEILEDAVSITIKEDNDEREKGGHVSNKGVEEQAEDPNNAETFRSKSTGHSIICTNRVGGGDRFTLILPEHVKTKIIRGHNLTRSCTTFGEFRSRISTGNGGFGELSGIGISGGEVNKV